MTVGEMRTILKSFSDDMPIMGFDTSNDSIWTLEADNDCPAYDYQDASGNYAIMLTLVTEVDRL